MFDKKIEILKTILIKILKATRLLLARGYTNYPQFPASCELHILNGSESDWSLQPVVAQWKVNCQVAKCRSVLHYLPGPACTKFVFNVTNLASKMWYILFLVLKACSST